MTAIKNMNQVEAARAGRPTMPLSYEKACEHYANWHECESVTQGIVALGVPTPSEHLSHVEGSTWHLKNVNGLLAKVGANGRVWRPRREDD